MIRSKEKDYCAQSKMVSCSFSQTSMIAPLSLEHLGYSKASFCLFASPHPWDMKIVTRMARLSSFASGREEDEEHRTSRRVANTASLANRNLDFSSRNLSISLQLCHTSCVFSVELDSLEDMLTQTKGLGRFSPSCLERITRLVA